MTSNWRQVVSRVTKGNAPHQVPSLLDWHRLNGIQPNKGNFIYLIFFYLNTSFGIKKNRYDSGHQLYE